MIKSDKVNTVVTRWFCDVHPLMEMQRTGIQKLSSHPIIGYYCKVCGLEKEHWTTEVYPKVTYEPVVE